MSNGCMVHNFCQGHQLFPTPNARTSTYYRDLNNSNNVHTQFNVVLAKHPNILLHLGTKPWLKGSYPKEWSPCVMLKMNDDRQHEMIPKNL